jgi:carboxymethylenebutenolidase
MRALLHNVAEALSSRAVCHDPDSGPPLRPIAGASVSHHDLVLEAADGTRFAAFSAGPDEPARCGVVVLPDVRGLHHFYEELTLRLGEHGIAAVAIDYFGRTAGVGKRDEDFAYAEHVPLSTAAGIQTDVGAAVSHLRSQGVQAVFTVGFCFGGRHSWLSTAGGHELAGAVGFYGSTGPRNGEPGPTQRAGEFRAPILALMGGADQAITADDIAAFHAALTEAGPEHHVVTYHGAPHSFFDRKQEQFAHASADAWRRVLSFFETHMPA